MIKKSVFEDELIAGMQHRLAEQNSDNLVSAVGYLNSAVEILEDAGMFSQADQVLKLLFKIAVTRKTKPVQEMISLEKLMELGVSREDMMNFGKDPMARARVNLALRKSNYTEPQIKKFIGPDAYMTEEEVRSWLDPQGGMAKIWKWVMQPKEVQQEAFQQKIQETPATPATPLEPGKEIEFTSIAKEHKRPADPRKIPDHTTRGLTPAQMIKNLLHHGTEFNMSDDGNVVVDDNSTEDLLNAEIDDNLEVTEADYQSAFEDER